MTSPYLELPKRSPEEVLRSRASRLKEEGCKPCPFCGEDPPLCAQKFGPSEYTQYMVGCENDDCAANPQVSGKTVSEAWAKWNGRA